MTEILTREEVARAIVRAETPEELDEARTMRETYLQKNPDDKDIRAMDELLESLTDALTPKESQSGEIDTQR
ncbi:MAG: hypothetical protein H8F28_22470 [Fibrella sp.]|nr:hypothetical protein [Armatimonadota bacterium]